MQVSQRFQWGWRPALHVPFRAPGCLALLVGLTLWSGSVEAGPLRTHGTDIHLDLVPNTQEGIDVGTFGGGFPAFAVLQQFDDGTDGDVWHWETEIINIHNQNIQFTATWETPVGTWVRQVGPLVPGAIYPIDLHFDESAVQELGDWTWSVINLNPFPIGIDTSITEDPDLIPTPFDVPTEGSLTFKVDSVPEPGTTVYFTEAILLWLLFNRRKRV